MHALHFRKGCYTGQEILIKAVQTNAVRQRLVGLSLAPTNSLPSPTHSSNVSTPLAALIDEEGTINL